MVELTPLCLSAGTRIRSKMCTGMLITETSEKQETLAESRSRALAALPAQPAALLITEHRRAVALLLYVNYRINKWPTAVAGHMVVNCLYLIRL